MSTTIATRHRPASSARPAREIVRRFVQGDLASLRVILGVAVIWIIFQSQNDRFLTAVNLTNLMLQITAVGLISVGVVYVLLLGEIDLSVGAVSGLAAAVMAVLNVKHGWNPYLAIAAGVLCGMAIGAGPGRALHRLRHPVVRGHARRPPDLAGRAALRARRHRHDQHHEQQDHRASPTPSTRTRSAGPWPWSRSAPTPRSRLWAWRQRVAAGLADRQLTGPLIRIVVVAAAVIAAVAILNSDRGVPLAVLILVGFVAGMEYVARRTTFGRHVFAVGGNAEAARRAGISVHKIRVIVFAIAGSMAAIGGIMQASRLLAVNQGSGGNDLLLLAIAGPVIAGTSLFGGRGSVWSALLGALVIGSISNGMDLLALESSVKFMVTGGVLLLAVIVDALARSQRQAAGRL